MKPFNNPFRPGAGQRPPYLAGREVETNVFKSLLKQSPILKNMVLTGLRGVGKTVLLDTFKPIAIKNGWFWAGTDLSEASSMSEQLFSIRLLVDLSIITSPFTIKREEQKTIGFKPESTVREIKLTYEVLHHVYTTTPGLESDKLKRILELVWEVVKSKIKGIVLAYDEAQILKDKAVEKQFPLSLLLEVVQFIQRKEIPFLLVLTGLPTLPQNLVEARTYAERMFQVIHLSKLNDKDAREAILKPTTPNSCPVTFSEHEIREIIKYSSGYPYFVQFFCREAFDSYLQQIEAKFHPIIKISAFIHKLDSDFYVGRWSRITDRQRDLLYIIAKLPTANEEFTVKEIVSKSTAVNNPFKQAHVNNILVKLIDFGLLYKNSRGKYSFAVPLLADYINRQAVEPYSA